MRIKVSWCENDYHALCADLERLADAPYRKFHQKLLAGSSIVLGVRMPKLRLLAKEIAVGEANMLFPFLKENIYEEMMLYGLILGYRKTTFSCFLEDLKEFIPKINNWAVSDYTVAGLKTVKLDRERFFTFLQPYLVSENEYEVRFAVVALKTYYTDTFWIDRILAVYRRINHPGYYVKMAVAWGVAEAYIKEREKTEILLQEHCLNKETQNKSIQKIRESYRVTAVEKERVKQMRI